MLRAANLDGLVVALPTNVLLVSGYWPIVGTACAVVGPGGTVVVAPRDESAMAARGWADMVVPFAPASLDRIETPAEAIREPFHSALQRAGVTRGRVGVESGNGFEPRAYVGMHAYGTRLDALLRTHGGITPVSVDDALASLRAVVTEHELRRIAVACRIAEHAFVCAAPKLRPGLMEVTAAAFFREPLSRPRGDSMVENADGFAFCMSGPNAARAYGAFARSTTTTLVPGTLVLVHCNSVADGYWTDITRTYSLGAPDARQRALYDAVFAARTAALDAVRPGVRASSIDAAARRVLCERGFGDAFRHATGHGVGFAAIDHNAPPRLHPRSTDVLEVGMVFNIEPGIYIDGYGGMRHCDVVALTDQGPRVLTPFHDSLQELTLAGSG